ncbi:MAG: hypothetical protein ABSG25_11375 [Bryobacteraceae bacterium]
MSLTLKLTLQVKQGTVELTEDLFKELTDLGNSIFYQTQPLTYPYPQLVQKWWVQYADPAWNQPITVWTKIDQNDLVQITLNAVVPTLNHMVYTDPGNILDLDGEEMVPD